MELFIALGLPIVLLIGLTFLFMSDGIPVWIQNLNRNSSTIWNFGIVAISTMTVIIYLAKRYIRFILGKYEGTLFCLVLRNLA